MKNLLNTHKPFELICESSASVHNSFVTALEYIKIGFEDYKIISGDAFGNASITHYKFNNGKLTNSSLVKSFKSNDERIMVKSVNLSSLCT